MSLQEAGTVNLFTVIPFRLKKVASAIIHKKWDWGKYAKLDELLTVRWKSLSHLSYQDGSRHSTV